jgi:hypothetical protein
VNHLLSLADDIRELTKSPELKSIGRSLSKVSQLGGQADQSFLREEDPVMQNFFRKGNAKATVKTAGFGSLNESMKMSSRIREAKIESEESSSDEDDGGGERRHFVK